MHNLKNLVCASFFICNGVFAMQENRQEVIQQAVELISANARIFEIAYQLAMSAARALKEQPSKTASKPSKELILEAKQWMGSAVDFGKDHGWPKGIYENQQFVALYFLRAAGYWLTYYLDMKLYAELLKNYPEDESVINFISNELKEHRDKKAPPGMRIDIKAHYEPQQQHEIDEAGEYPAIDYEGLMYSPWSNIITTLEPLFREKVPYFTFANKLRKPLRERLMKNDLQLQEASYYFIGYQDIKNGTYKSGTFGKLFEAPAREVYKKQESLREAFVNDKLRAPLADLEDIIISLDNSLNIFRSIPKKSRNIAKAPQQKVEPVAKKLIEPQEKAESDIPLKTKTPQKFATAPVLQIATSEKKSEKVYNKDEASQGSPVIHNPFLTQEVVEKFLDIFGNQKGQKKNKNKGSYRCQGWGSIKDLKDKLAKAGWLLNQREVNGELQNEKHASSTISFRMPHSVKSVTAPVLKFHNDHTIGERMREITRHFIVKTLEHFGYSEEFLLAYYKYYFAKP